MENKRYVKNNPFLKMSLHVFNIFNESKDNNRLTTILTCLDTNPRYFLDNVVLQEQ